jgi:hypothetical protein
MLQSGQFLSFVTGTLPGPAPGTCVAVDQSDAAKVAACAAPARQNIAACNINNDDRISYMRTSQLGESFTQCRFISTVTRTYTVTHDQGSTFDSGTVIEHYEAVLPSLRKLTHGAVAHTIVNGKITESIWYSDSNGLKDTVKAFYRQMDLCGAGAAAECDALDQYVDTNNFMVAISAGDSVVGGHSRSDTTGTSMTWVQFKNWMLSQQPRCQASSTSCGTVSSTDTRTYEQQGASVIEHYSVLPGTCTATLRSQNSCISVAGTANDIAICSGNNGTRAACISANVTCTFYEAVTAAEAAACIGVTALHNETACLNTNRGCSFSAQTGISVNRFSVGEGTCSAADGSPGGPCAQIDRTTNPQGTISSKHVNCAAVKDPITAVATCKFEPSLQMPKIVQLFHYEVHHDDMCTNGGRDLTAHRFMALLDEISNERNTAMRTADIGRLNSLVWPPAQGSSTVRTDSPFVAVMTSGWHTIGTGIRFHVPNSVNNRAGILNFQGFVDFLAVTPSRTSSASYSASASYSMCYQATESAFVNCLNRIYTGDGEQIFVHYKVYGSTPGTVIERGGVLLTFDGEKIEQAYWFSL